MGTRQLSSAPGGFSQQPITWRCGFGPIWGATRAGVSLLYDPSKPRVTGAAGGISLPSRHISQAPNGSQAVEVAVHCEQRLVRNSASGVRITLFWKSIGSLRSAKPGLASRQVASSRWSAFGLAGSHQAIRKEGSLISPLTTWQPYW